MSIRPYLAVIGGSGLYNFPSLKDTETIEINTPYGSPSSPIILGKISGKQVAFLARHGLGHIFMPAEVNYRANIYALKSLGVNTIVSISACGSLREDYAPGDIVIPDQLVDNTRNRLLTFFGEGLVVHIGTADPYCQELRKLLVSAVEKTGANTHDGGTYITIEGPRFSTKAESNLYRQWGMSVIGMTAIPEAFLAREAEMCYATMAHVTDYDVWHISEKPVTVEMVIEVLNRNTEKAQKAICNLVEAHPEGLSCNCQSALDSAILTQSKFISKSTRRKYRLFLEKHDK